VACWIRGIGVAAGGWRLPTKDINAAWGRPGGRGQSAVVAADEDALTLGWAAATRALDAAGMTPEQVESMWWGTSRAPFGEGPSWTHLAATLRLGPTCGGTVISGSTHSGCDALAAALDALESGRLATTLVVMSDALNPAVGGSLEAVAGAGAVAVIVGSTGPGARITDTGSVWAPVLDRYRGDSEDETRDAYDGRLFREQIFLPLMGKAATGSDAGRWSIPDPDGRMAATLGQRIGAAEVVSAPSRSELGDCGAAATLVGSAAALGATGPISLLFYGAGRATRFDLDVDSAVPGAERSQVDLSGGRLVGYPQVLRSRRRLVTTGESVEMAVPPGSAMFVRGNHETLGFLGGRCTKCATVNIPPSIHPTCISCGATEFDEVALARTGTVHTFVINQTMPQPFEAPLPLIVTDLDDGSRIQLQGATDGSDIAVGTRVEAVLRRYTIERGVPIYGWKFQPITTRAEVAS